MSLTVTIPYKNTFVGGIQCDFFAAHNPFIVRLQRKDYTVTGTADNGSGKVRVTISGTLAEDLPADDYVYISSGNIVGAYQVLTLASSGASTFDLDLTFVANTTGGYTNLTTTRTNYYIEMKLLLYAVGFASTSVHATKKIVPDASGLAVVDISRNIKTALVASNDYDYSNVNAENWRDWNLSRKFALTAQEFWDDSDEAIVSGYTFYAANGAMQLRSYGGVCMAPYYPDNIPTGGAKFLSDMTRPKYWPGLPFDLQFIFNNAMHSYGTVKRYEQAFNNSTATTGSNTALDSAQRNYINRMLIAGGYASTDSHVLVWVGSPITGSEYINVNYIDDGYFTDGASGRFTEKIHVRIHHCIPRNAVYLAWLNKKAGWNYYCFGVRQTSGRKTGTDGEFAHFIEDLENAKSTSSFLNKASEPYLICGADQLDQYDVEGIESLIDSPMVLILTNPDTWTASRPLWNEVKLDVGDYKTRDTKKVYNSIQFKIRLPELFIQSV